MVDTLHLHLLFRWTSRRSRLCTNLAHLYANPCGSARRLPGCRGIPGRRSEATKVQVWLAFAAPCKVGSLIVLHVTAEDS